MNLDFLFPENVYTAWIRGGTSQPLSGGESEIVANAVEQRKKELQSGRSCAREALKKMGRETPELLKGEYGLPLWPDGVVGSISHSGDYAVAAVSESHRGVGVDVERLDRRMNEAMERRIFRPEEREALNAMNQERRAATRILLFSAREALFKCLFPVYQIYFGFHAVRLHHDNLPAGSRESGEVVAGGWTFEWIRKPEQTFPDAHRIEGKYLFYRDVVFTSAVWHGSTGSLSTGKAGR